jgi:hypothetical protein
VKTYTWIDYGEGGRTNLEDAQAIGELVEELGGAVGADPNADFITEFVDRSRPPAAPTHKFFEWDDARAGELYRRNQARNLVRRVAVEIVVDEQTTRRQRVIEVLSMPVKDEETGEEVTTRRYYTQDQIKADPKKAAQMLHQALNELICFQNKWKNYREFYAEFAALDGISREIDQLRLKLYPRSGSFTGEDEGGEMEDAAG